MKLMPAVKNVHVGLVFLLSLAAISCYAAPKQNSSDLTLKWYDGLILGDIFDPQIPSDSKQNLKKQLSANWGVTVDLVSPAKQSEHHSVKSCDDFFKAQMHHWEPVNAYETGSYMMMGMLCHAVKIISSGSDAKMSFIGQYKLSKNITDEFPPQFANIISTEERKRIFSNKKITTWKSAASIKSITVENDHKAVVKEAGSTQEVDLLAQGDFNSDGIADILVMVGNTVDEGSYSSTELYLLTKPKQQNLFVLLKQYPIY